MNQDEATKRRGLGAKQPALRTGLGKDASNLSNFSKPNIKNGGQYMRKGSNKVTKHK
jgi:hypothetical protein